jgi:hypothetical protein
VGQLATLSVSGQSANLSSKSQPASLSFRGRFSPEESAFFADFEQQQVPRFAWNDNEESVSA